MFLNSFFSVQLNLLFFAKGHSPTKSNFIVLCLYYMPKISTQMVCVSSISTLVFLRKFLSLLLVHVLIFMCMFVGLCYKFIQ